MRYSVTTQILPLLAAATAGGPAIADEVPLPLVVGGYVETYYQWNFLEPDNRLTHFRGFDNRHNTFTLSNVAVDAAWDKDKVVGRIALQVGHTPSTYYLAEPALPGAAGANATGPELWKYVQQAYAGYRFGEVLVTGGVFLSPIGPEGIAVKDNWNWSRSTLFFALPFYHTGVRASYPLNENWQASVAAFNGWNSVVDNNSGKSFTGQVIYSRPEKVALSILYFGGVERARGAPEGQAFRHLLDAHVTLQLVPSFAVLLHGNTGFEPTNFGTSYWTAGALYGRWQPISRLFIAARGDLLYEKLASNQAGTASPIFFPAKWVASATGTLDYRPASQVSFRLEYRHDHAAADLYFDESTVGDGAALPFVMNRAAQDSVIGGITAWF